MGAIKSKVCALGHRLKLGKDGRQRCPICQSAYLKKWRENKKRDKEVVEFIKKPLRIRPELLDSGEINDFFGITKWREKQKGKPK